METIDCLADGLDRERQSARKLFPEELKGSELVSRTILLDSGPLGLITGSQGITASGCLRANGS